MVEPKPYSKIDTNTLDATLLDFRHNIKGDTNAECGISMKRLNAI